MQCTHTLDDIRREGNLLEFDVTVNPDGLLCITKRGDAALFYQSLQPLNDPRVLPDAWAWLQRCRATIEQLDQVRASIATGREPTRQSDTLVTVLLFVAHFLPAIAIGATLNAVTGNFYIGYGAYLLLMVATWLLMSSRYAKKETRSENGTVTRVTAESLARIGWLDALRHRKRGGQRMRQVPAHTGPAGGASRDYLIT